MQAGATIVNDMNNADVILAVKEIPVEKLLPNKSYMFFSHTHKGQRHNMPSLKAVLDKVRLLPPNPTRCMRAYARAPAC